MRKTSLLLALGLAACGSDNKKPVTTPTNPNVIVNPNDGTVIVDPGQEMPPTTVDPAKTPTFDEGAAASYSINPVDPAKTYNGPTIVRQGRMVASGNNWLFNWAGSSFTCRPAATSVTIGITVPNATATSAQIMDVFIDGKLGTPVTLVNTTTSYPLTLPDANPHIVTWVLRTEGNYGQGDILFTGITPATGGTLLPTETVTTPRQIEFIGDSITVGYGARSQLHAPVLGRDNGCTTTGAYTPYTQDSSTESASLSFSTLTAHHFGAQYSLVASSGRGVYRNASNSSTNDIPGTATPTMPTLWQYALYPYQTNTSGTTVTGRPAWDAAAATAAGWSPQAVVINLGTNDYAAHGRDATDPNKEAFPVDDGAFTTAYTSLLNNVHTLYPQAKIFIVVGPMLTTTKKAAATAGITTAMGSVDPGNTFTTLVDAGVQNVTDTTSTGCEYHPLPSEHQNVSGALVTKMASVLSWQ